jgi:SAM-dependent methyltransferase
LANLHGYSICADVSFRVVSDGILASNHRAREHVLLNLPLFDALAGGDPAGAGLCAWDRTRFSNLDGLLADPTCLDTGALGEPTRFATREDAWGYLAKHFILIHDPAEYGAYFAARSSLVDHKHLGTFHQRLGAELRLRERIDPDVWWYAQKFDPQTGAVRDNLYEFVQQAFLDEYIPSLDLNGRTVLDFGCGAGMASRLFTARGAHVTGVDPDPEQLERAARQAGDDFTPVKLELSSPQPLASIPVGPFDLVWLSDVLLFYFYPQDAGEPLMAATDLLGQLGERLAPNGRLVIMMPHGVFWLAPWLGDAERPHTVLSEYADRVYSVVPGLAELADAIERAGLCIRCIREPRPSDAGRSVDPRAFHFADNFPLWWVFECLKTP